MKGIIILLFTFITTWSSAQSQKSMLDYMNETASIYPGCEYSTNKIKCLEDNIRNTILEKINNLKVNGAKKITLKVSIRVEKTGEITITKLETENKIIEDLTRNTLTELPTIIPSFSQINNEPTTASYVFFVHVEKNKKYNNYELKEKNNKFDLSKAPYPPNQDYTHVVFPGCENEKKENYRNCFSMKLTNFITIGLGEEFIANNKNSKANCLLTFNKNGRINKINIKTENKALEFKLKELINDLPKVIPALKNGENTKITYSIPVKL